MPIWHVQDLHSTDPTQETCPRSCRLYSTAPTRQHELDHTDHTDHADHTGHECICSERSRSRTVLIARTYDTDNTNHLSNVCNRRKLCACSERSRSRTVLIARTYDTDNANHLSNVCNRRKLCADFPPDPTVLLVGMPVNDSTAYLPRTCLLYTSPSPRD